MSSLLLHSCCTSRFLAAAAAAAFQRYSVSSPLFGKTTTSRCATTFSYFLDHRRQQQQQQQQQKQTKSKWMSSSSIITTPSSSTLLSSSTNVNENNDATVTATATKTQSLLLLGGDFAGYQATFDYETGSMIPIPDYLIPSSLLEWGQAPTALEVLVSEEKENSNQNDWTRYTITVLPETGCGIDNLETTKVQDRVQTLLLATTPEKDTKAPSAAAASVQVAVIQKNNNNNNNKFMLEVTFPWFASSSTSSGDKQEEDDDVYRARLSIDLVMTKCAKAAAATILSSLDVQEEQQPQQDKFYFQPLNPLRMALERRDSDQSTSGRRGEGGGLDGRSVSQWIGPALRRNSNFAEEQKPLPLSSSSTTTEDNANTGSISTTTAPCESSDEKHPSTVSLPADFTFAWKPCEVYNYICDQGCHVAEFGQVLLPGLKQVVQIKLKSSLSSSSSMMIGNSDDNQWLKKLFSATLRLEKSGASCQEEF